MKISEIFTSIQGESSFAGIPTMFIRLYGCNLDCKWCDSDYARKEEKFSEISAADILKNIESELVYRHNNYMFVCFTGGEPLIQAPELILLIKVLRERFGGSIVISIETNGSYAIPKELIELGCYIITDIKCPSSGNPMSHGDIYALMRCLDKNSEIKFVIKDEADFIYAQDVVDLIIPEQYKNNRSIIFSPCMGKEQEDWPKELASRILRNKLPVRMQIQMHKVIWPEVTRGV
jgi:7-carboxy-7-deazaguanine synthase